MLPIASREPQQLVLFPIFRPHLFAPVHDAQPILDSEQQKYLLQPIAPSPFTQAPIGLVPYALAPAQIAWRSAPR